VPSGDQASAITGPVNPDNTVDCAVNGVGDGVCIAGGCVLVGSLVRVGEALGREGCAEGLSGIWLAAGRSAVVRTVEVLTTTQPEIIRATPNRSQFLMKWISLLVVIKTSLSLYYPTHSSKVPVRIVR
jgi:hypothetical protein